MLYSRCWLLYLGFALLVATSGCAGLFAYETHRLDSSGQGLDRNQAVENMKRCMKYATDDNGSKVITSVREDGLMYGNQVFHWDETSHRAEIPVHEHGSPGRAVLHWREYGFLKYAGQPGRGRNYGICTVYIRKEDVKTFVDALAVLVRHASLSR